MIGALDKQMYINSDMKYYTRWSIAYASCSDTVNTVKPAQAVTSIKQSPVLKDHHFLVL